MQQRLFACFCACIAGLSVCIAGLSVRVYVMASLCVCYNTESLKEQHQQFSVAKVRLVCIPGSDPPARHLQNWLDNLCSCWEGNSHR